MGVKIDNIINPFGSGSMAISVKVVTDALKEKYKNFVESTIEVNAMKIKDNYFLYFQVPSKENKEYPDDVIFYDVIIELIPPNSAWKLHKSIRDYDVKVFSNNPKHMFTFTYVFNKRRALIDLPVKYYSKQALRIAPKKRNPMQLLGIDENLYHCVLYMDKHNLFDRDVLEALIQTSNLDWKSLLEEITPQEEKMKEVSDRDLRHRALTRRKNSKVWESGSKKAQLKNELLKESRNLSKETPNNPEGSKLLKTKMLSNLRARLSLIRGDSGLDRLSSNLSNSNTRKSNNNGSNLKNHGLRSSKLKSSI